MSDKWRNIFHWIGITILLLVTALGLFLVYSDLRSGTQSRQELKATIKKNGQQLDKIKKRVKRLRSKLQKLDKKRRQR